MNLAARFWSKVVKGSRNECWLWKAGRVQGYGAFWYKVGPARAHQVSWELTNKRAIPKGLIIMHSCDTPLCVNPKHLILGTHQQNISDRDQKGRQRTTHGTEHPLAKLNDDDVRFIRASPLGQRKLAAQYGVSQSLIHRIRARLSWAHVA